MDGGRWRNRWKGASGSPVVCDGELLLDVEVVSNGMLKNGEGGQKYGQ